MVQVKIESGRPRSGQSTQNIRRVNELQQEMELFLHDEMIEDFIEAELQGLKFDFTPIF